MKRYLIKNKMSLRGNVKEQEILEKLNEEINEINKDRLLIYVMRIQNQRNKCRKKVRIG